MASSGSARSSSSKKRKSTDTLQSDARGTHTPLSCSESCFNEPYDTVEGSVKKRKSHANSSQATASLVPTVGKDASAQRRKYVVHAFLFILV